MLSILNLSLFDVFKMISFAVDVWIVKLALLLKVVVLIVPRPISKLVIGMVLPIPTLPMLSILNRSLSEVFNIILPCVLVFEI